MGITSKDIASICGVSRGTVDRALNNKGRINAETKEKILKTAKELGYRPDLLARSLVKGRSMSIGVVVFDIKNHYFAQLVNSIEIEAKKKGYFVNITIQENDPELEIRLINNLIDRRIDGLILCPANKGSDFHKFLAGLPVPVIVIGNLISPDIPFIGIDERKAAKEATEMIASKGYERIVFVCPPLEYELRDNIYSHKQRLMGFKDAAKILKTIQYDVISNNNYINDIDKLLYKNSNRTALFCSGDIFALNVLKHLKATGRRVPVDVGIMGFDNIDILEYVTPSLATIYNPVEEIGVKAVENLLGLIEGERLDKFQLLEHKLIDGDSL